MVDVAQLVRAPVCGTGGRRFKSAHPPQEKKIYISTYILNKFFKYRTVVVF